MREELKFAAMECGGLFVMGDYGTPMMPLLSADNWDTKIQVGNSSRLLGSEGMHTRKFIADW